jgi:hypothetical protein
MRSREFSAKRAGLVDVLRRRQRFGDARRKRAGLL